MGEPDWFPPPARKTFLFKNFREQKLRHRQSSLCMAVWDCKNAWAPLWKIWPQVWRSSGSPTPAPATGLLALTQEQVRQEAVPRPWLTDSRKTPMKPEVAIHWMRITLNSHNVKSVEKVHADLIRDTKEMNLNLSPKVKGPVWMTAKTLKVMVRQTHSGEGSKALRFSKVGSRWKSTATHWLAQSFRD